MVYSWLCFICCYQIILSHLKTFIFAQLFYCAHLTMTDILFKHSTGKLFKLYVWYHYTLFVLKIFYDFLWNLDIREDKLIKHCQRICSLFVPKFLTVLYINFNGTDIYFNVEERKKKHDIELSEWKLTVW